MLPVEIKNSISKEIKETNKQIFSQSLGFISSAFVLVAALAWNDAIKAVITKYFKDTNSGIFSMLTYAVIVTIVAVLITMRLNKLSEKIKGENQEK